MPSIILIEDNPVDAELTLRTLRKANISSDIRVFFEASAAREYLFSHPEAALFPPKLILLDINLGAESGLDILDHLRQHSRLSHIPVIVLTGYNTDSTVVQSYERGIAGFIVKPLDMAQFEVVLQSIGLYHELVLIPTKDGYHD